MRVKYTWSISPSMLVVVLAADNAQPFLQEAGLKSKRHVKFMLQTMRKAGALQTKPAGKGKNYVYVLRTPSQKASNKRPPQVDTSTEATAARILG